MKNQDNIIEIVSTRAEAFLRIQKSDIYKKVCGWEDYRNSKASESTFFRKRLPFKRELRRTAETQGNLCATHLEDDNKGYPEGFINYDTFDKRRNENYEKNNEKFRLRKKI